MCVFYSFFLLFLSPRDEVIATDEEREGEQPRPVIIPLSPLMATMLSLSLPLSLSSLCPVKY